MTKGSAVYNTGTRAIVALRLALSVTGGGTCDQKGSLSLGRCEWKSGRLCKASPARAHACAACRLVQLRRTLMLPTPSLERSSGRRSRAVGSRQRQSLLLGYLLSGEGGRLGLLLLGE